MSITQKLMSNTQKFMSISQKKFLSNGHKLASAS